MGSHCITSTVRHQPGPCGAHYDVPRNECVLFPPSHPGTAHPPLLSVDIRDSVAYKELMEQYSLGPNGGILTALNLFATRFDQVLSALERRDDAPPAERPSFVALRDASQLS